MALFDLDMMQSLYAKLGERVEAARKVVGRPLTYTEKILYAHLTQGDATTVYERGKSYVDFGPDRVAMQDATAQMALLQFMQAGRPKVAVPSTVHCDHLITAQVGSSEDLSKAVVENQEVYDFLSSVSNKYGIGFWKPERVSFTKWCLKTTHFGRYDDRNRLAHRKRGWIGNDCHRSGWRRCLRRNGWLAVGT